MAFSKPMSLDSDTSMSTGFLGSYRASGYIQPEMITLSQFVTLLASSGIRGPQHLDGLCLDQRGQMLNQGKQFTVFEDRAGFLEDIVIKRINVDPIAHPSTSVALNDSRKSHLRTIWLEILALSYQPIQSHPNVTKVYAWGFDYPVRNRKLAIPVLYMEKALCSLEDFLNNPRHYGLNDIPRQNLYQLCLDVLEGLICVHKAGVIHGDIKPANVLIYRTHDPMVPFIAKLNDFGMCIPLSNDVCLTYESYGGTPGWRAPELMAAKKATGPVEHHLLRKCEVFAFGLFVLSTLFYSGQVLFNESDASTESVLDKGLSLLKKYTESSEFDTQLTSKLEQLILDTLTPDPRERSDLNQNLLATADLDFRNWYYTCHQDRIGDSC